MIIGSHITMNALHQGVAVAAARNASDQRDGGTHASEKIGNFPKYDFLHPGSVDQMHSVGGVLRSSAHWKSKIAATGSGACFTTSILSGRSASMSVLRTHCRMTLRPFGISSRGREMGTGFKVPSPGTSYAWNRDGGRRLASRSSASVNLLDGLSCRAPTENRSVTFSQFCTP